MAETEGACPEKGGFLLFFTLWGSAYYVNFY